MSNCLVADGTGAAYGRAMRTCTAAGMVWSMASITCGWSAEVAEPVWVERIPVQPAGNLIYDDGRVELHPKALLGIGYDSNIDAAVEDPDDDVYARGLAGLVVHWLPAVADRFTIDGQVEARRYLDRDDRDFTGGRVSLGWLRESATGPLAAASIAGLLADDPLIETGRQVQRARYDGDAGWWLRGTTNTLRLGLSLVGEDFREDAGVFDERERDYLRPRVTAEWLFGRADGPTRLGVRVEMDRIDYRDGSSPYQDGTGLTAVLVVEHAVTPSMTLTGHAGAESRRYADDFAGDPVFDDQQVTRPVGQLLLRWDPEEYSRVDVGAASTLTPTIDANAAHLLQAWVHVRWRLRRSVGLVGEFDGYDLQRSGTAPGDAEREQTLRIRAGVELWARDGLVVRMLGGTDRGDLGGDDAYDRYVALMDTALVW